MSILSSMVFLLPSLLVLPLTESALAGPADLPKPEVTKLPPATNPPATQAAKPEAPAQPAEAAELVIDAKVPVEILLGGTTIGELLYPAVVHFQVAAAGKQVVRLYTNGQPTDVPVELPAGGSTRILVGRTGVTVDAQRPAAPGDKAPTVQQPAGPAPLELRFVGGGGATVRLDNQKHQVGPGKGLNTTVPLGKHALSVRSADGTVIWAAGDLFVDGPLIVQIAEGRLPEVSGAGRFVAGGG